MRLVRKADRQVGRLDYSGSDRMSEEYIRINQRSYGIIHQLQRHLFTPGQARLPPRLITRAKVNKLSLTAPSAEKFQPECGVF